jgi:flavin-dependent dehydrogenase
MGGDDWRGFHISRTELDAGLAGVAEALGAQLLLEAPRNVLGDGNCVEAVDFASCRLRPRVVIDCTGANRWLGRRVRAGYQTQSRRLFADYGFAVGVASNELPLIRASGEEWYWLAEVGDDRLHWTRVRTRHQKRAQLPAELDGCEVESRGATEVTWYTAARVAGPGWMLCGDAAARIDPVIGGGVLRGIAGAMQAVHAWVTGDPDAYQQWHDARVQSDMRAVTELYGAVGLSDWTRPPESVSGGEA